MRRAACRVSIDGMVVSCSRFHEDVVSDQILTQIDKAFAGKVLMYDRFLFGQEGDISISPITVGNSLIIKIWENRKTLVVARLAETILFVLEVQSQTGRGNRYFPGLLTAVKSNILNKRVADNLREGCRYVTRVYSDDTRLSAMFESASHEL